ncbi:hypothetical protein [Staphylococcus hominis]|uniref:hypothetical protein n=1 Tax=Staphylococcus hominis TaxID=1290 RepID=UPI00066ACEAC|nr:hypothetical protein [Staphylococcus hominis]
MKKIINILLIAILSVVFIGLVLFVLDFAKDIWSDSDTKIVDKRQHESSKDKNNKSSNNSSQDNNNEQSLTTSVEDQGNHTTATNNSENQSIESNDTQQQSSSNEQYITTNDKSKNTNNNYNENTYERPTDELGQTGGAPTPDNMKITLSELRETLKDVYDTPEELDKTMKEAKESGDYIDDGSED